MDDVEKPDWLVAGAEVVLYDTSRGSPYAVKSTIKKVNAKTFDVTDERQPRFRINGLRARMGGEWGWTRYVAPVDSDQAHAALLRVHNDRLMSAARTAVDRWQRSRTCDNRLAAIAALQAIQQDELPEPRGVR